MTAREERFEEMLRYVREQYDRTAALAETLKAEGKTKTATYRQMTADKFRYAELLELYRRFGLL